MAVIYQPPVGGFVPHTDRDSAGVFVTTSHYVDATPLQHDQQSITNLGLVVDTEATDDIYSGGEDVCVYMEDVQTPKLENVPITCPSDHNQKSDLARDIAGLDGNPNLASSVGISLKDFLLNLDDSGHVSARGQLKQIYSAMSSLTQKNDKITEISLEFLELVAGQLSNKFVEESVQTAQFWQWINVLYFRCNLKRNFEFPHASLCFRVHKILFKIFSQIISPEIYSKNLEMFQYNQFFSGDNSRFRHLIELFTISDDSQKITILTFINFVISTPSLVDNRIKIRNEMNILGFSRCLEKIKKGTKNEQLLLQIKAIDAQQNSDLELYKNRIMHYKSLYQVPNLDSSVNSFPSPKKGKSPTRASQVTQTMSLMCGTLISAASKSPEMLAQLFEIFRGLLCLPIPTIPTSDSPSPFPASNSQNQSVDNWANFIEYVHNYFNQNSSSSLSSPPSSSHSPSPSASPRLEEKKIKKKQFQNKNFEKENLEKEKLEFSKENLSVKKEEEMKDDEDKEIQIKELKQQLIKSTQLLNQHAKAVQVVQQNLANLSEQKSRLEQQHTDHVSNLNKKIFKIQNLLNVSQKKHQRELHDLANNYSEKIKELKKKLYVCSDSEKRHKDNLLHYFQIKQDLELEIKELQRKLAKAEGKVEKLLRRESSRANYAIIPDSRSPSIPGGSPAPSSAPSPPVNPPAIPPVQQQKPAVQNFDYGKEPEADKEKEIFELKNQLRNSAMKLCDNEKRFLHLQKNFSETMNEKEREISLLQQRVRALSKSQKILQQLVQQNESPGGGNSDEKTENSSPNSTVGTPSKSEENSTPLTRRQLASKSLGKTSQSPILKKPASKSYDKKVARKFYKRGSSGGSSGSSRSSEENSRSSTYHSDYDFYDEDDIYGPYVPKQNQDQVSSLKVSQGLNKNSNPSGSSSSPSPPSTPSFVPSPIPVVSLHLDSPRHERLKPAETKNSPRQHRGTASLSVSSSSFTTSSPRSSPSTLSPRSSPPRSSPPRSPSPSPSPSSSPTKPRLNSPKSSPTKSSPSKTKYKVKFFSEENSQNSAQKAHSSDKTDVRKRSVTWADEQKFFSPSPSSSPAITSLDSSSSLISMSPSAPVVPSGIPKMGSEGTITASKSIPENEHVSPPSPPSPLPPSPPSPILQHKPPQNQKNDVYKIEEKSSEKSSENNDDDDHHRHHDDDEAQREAKRLMKTMGRRIPSFGNDWGLGSFAKISEIASKSNPELLSPHAKVTTTPPSVNSTSNSKPSYSSFLVGTGSHSPSSTHSTSPSSSHPPASSSSSALPRWKIAQMEREKDYQQKIIQEQLAKINKLNLLKQKTNTSQEEDHDQ